MYYEQIGKEICDISNEIPFEIPDSWEWVRLGHICEIARGGSPRPIKQYLTEDTNGINWIKIGDSDKGGKYINSTKEKIKPEGLSKSRFVHAGDFLLTNSMSFGRPYILNVDGCIHDGWLVLSGYNMTYDKDFLFYMLSSKFAYYQFCGIVSGAVVKNLNSDKVADAIFPLPPLSEQHRIVSKIEELLPYIEKYDKAETQLTKLNADFPEMLKKSILQEAVQGKLVPQNPDDEPASVLLERIRAEKLKLIKEGKIKKDKHESVIITRDKIPYVIPDSWVWCRLAELGEIIGGGTPKTSEPEYWNNGNIPWLTPADMKFVKGKYVNKGERFITENGLNHSSSQLMPKGTILYSSRAPIGYIAIAENDICTNQGFKSLVPVFFEMNQYLYYCLIEKTPDIQSRASGTTFKEISGTEFGNTLIPLPPLNEQERIVTKIEELMPFITAISK